MDEPIATSEVSKKISAISKESIHRICSGQVVLDLSIAVKELVENSLDSGATVIEVKLTDFGKTCISVIDNGSGVVEKDFEGLGMKHHTSKLREFSDLLQVATFGFRGEALSSLCALSNLSITTRHSSSQHAFHLQFDKNGCLIHKKECARQQGTTVFVRDIFKNLPVRYKEFEKNIKKEFGKLIQILNSYCLVSTGIKIICTNTVANKSANILTSTTGSPNILDNITAVFGRKARENLIEIKMLPPDEEILNEYNLPSDVSINFSWDCFVSCCNHTLGRSSPDRQFFFVNGRPCDLSKISKMINYIYHQYNNKQYPFVYLNIKLDKSCADVNVTPDKRTILFTQEQVIIATIKSNFVKTWNSNQGVFSVKSLEDFTSKSIKRNISCSPENSPPLKRSMIQNFKSNLNKNISREKCTVMEDIKAKLNKFKSTEKNNFSEEVSKMGNAEINEPESDYGSEEMFQQDSIKISVKECKENFIKITEKLFEEETENFSSDSEDNDKSLEKEMKIKKKLPDVTMTISLDSIKEKLNKLKIAKEIKKVTDNRIRYRTELNSKASDVEKELERELTKESFNKMDIIGQFNLGFIITRLENDIFIIDQHASDEKFRFEKLSNETKLKTQKLILPKPLNLALLNESILLENQQIFIDNGFTFSINEQASSGNRVSLTGMPVSFNWQFGQEDIEELIFLIREGGLDGSNTNQTPRPSRVRQMLASRACRSAVMIGKTLNHANMRQLVEQMSEMVNPWNCPHGRPTMRHLISLTLLKK